MKLFKQLQKQKCLIVIMKPSLAVVSKNLTEDILEKIFKLKTGDDIKNIEITKATQDGEGFLSTVFRIKVIGKKCSASFIAKGFINDEHIKKSLNSAKFFRREAFFYSEVLPILVDLQKSMGASECIQKSVAKCYGFHVDGVNDFILLEDLRERGCTGLSEHPLKNEVQSVLAALAHLHAVSMTLRVKKPDVFKRIADSIPEVYYTEKNRNWYSKFLQKVIAINRQVLSECENQETIYYKKFNELVSQDVYGCLIEMSSTRGDYSAINHGDSWAPNFLRSENGTVLIDFQIIRCTSPVADLMLFLNSSTNVCANKAQFQDVLNHYYSSLDHYLKDMGMDVETVFPRTVFEKDVKLYGKFGICTSLTCIALLANDNKNTEPKEDFSAYDRIPLEMLWKVNPMTDKEYQKRFVNVLRLAVDAELI